MLKIFISILLFTNPIWAGCATNLNDGKVWCAANQGCGTNRNDGKVYCGPGQCATNRNDGRVYCSRFPRGGAATNHNDGMVYCTCADGANDLRTDSCVIAECLANQS